MPSRIGKDVDVAAVTSADTAVTGFRQLLEPSPLRDDIPRTTAMLQLETRLLLTWTPWPLEKEVDDIAPIFAPLTIMVLVLLSRPFSNSTLAALRLSFN